MCQPKEEKKAGEKAEQEAGLAPSEDAVAQRERVIDPKKSLLKKFLGQCSKADMKELHKLIGKGKTLGEALDAYSVYSEWLAKELQESRG